MANIIYSIYIEIEEKDYDTNVGSYYYDEKSGISKSKRSHQEYEKYKKELTLSKEIYSDLNNCEFILFGNDKDFKNFEKKMKKIHPALTKYEIINFYKFDRAEYLSKKYDKILFIDFDVIPNNFDNFFDFYDPTTIAVQDSPIRVDINKDVLTGRWILDSRAPEAKRYNCNLLLDYYGYQQKDNRAWNTAIMGFSDETLSKLSYFEQIENVLYAMGEIKNQPREDSLKRLLGYDNETVFGFRVMINNVDYKILPIKWHYIVDDLTIRRVTNSITFCHCIDKQFVRFFG